MGPQAVHLIQSKPFCTGFGFGLSLRQFRVLLEDTAEMGLCYWDQIPRNFPCREQPQPATTIF